MSSEGSNLPPEGPRLPERTSSRPNSRKLGRAPRCSLAAKGEVAMKLELGCGRAPTPGYVHHDRRKHSPHVDVAHDLDELPWPWPDGSCEEILGLDVFEHLHLMP